MRKRWIALVAALSVTALLSACGGGGGGGAPAKAVSKKAVSGTVALSGTVAKASLADAADVEITSYEKTPQLDKDNQPIPLDRILLSTGAIGAFSGQITMADAGGYLVLVVKKDGYTDYIKRIDFDKPSDVNLRGLLEKVNTVFHNVSTSGAVTVSVAGKPIKAFTFAVVSYPDGTRKAIAGNALKAAKAAGATTELKVDIPVDSLKQTDGTLVTNKLAGKLKSFDSSNPADADKFPGDYADANGNRLVSLGFDYINITDANTGTNLGAIVKTAKAAGKLSKSAAATPTIVTRHIPSGSCNNLLNDFCTGATTDDPLCANLDATSKGGFNVPIYTNNSRKGSWDLLGLGTVDVNNDGIIDASDAAANVSKTACTTAGGYYLRILVTNEDFIKSWWNLDYPLLFAQPKVLCVSGTVKDDKNNPLSVWLNLYDDDSTQSFNYAYASTDNSGAYTMKAVLLDSADTDRTGTISYYNPFGYQYDTKPVTLGDWPNNCGKADITITKPLRCVAEGTVVKDDGTPTGSPGGTIPKTAAKLVGTSGQTVQISSSTSSYFYTSAVTDANGFFTAEVDCNKDLDVYLGNNWNAKATTFNANGTVDPLSEKSDTAATTSAPGKVVLKELQPVNQAPTGYGYLSPSSIRDTDAATVYVYGYDPDGDYPLSYSITSGTAINKSGSIPSGSSSVNVSLSALAVGDYPLTLVVTDSRSKSSTPYNIGALRVTHLNRNPVISSATSNPTTIDPTVTTNKTFNFSGAATDPDGDTPTYTWRVTSGTTTVATLTGANASFTVPTNATDPTTYTVQLTVTDGKGGSASSAPFNIFYKSPPVSNIAPVITSAQSDKLAVKPGDASRVFTFTAAAQDPNNDTLTYNWTVDGTSIGAGASVTFTVPTTATDPTKYTVVVTVSDGKGGSATKTFDVFYASGSDTTVTVQ